jgi:beta-glucosidase-like glycosyl hydrolase
MSTAKHFPGYGGVTFDTEHGQLAVQGAIPGFAQFQVASQAGPEFVMSVAGVIYTPIDPNLVFTLSPAGIKLLRDSVAGDYLVITDDLGTDTMMQAYTLRNTIVQATRVGVDVLLVCHSPYPLEAYGYLSEAVRNGEITEAEIDERFSRIIRLKQKYFSRD